MTYISSYSGLMCFVLALTGVSWIFSTQVFTDYLNYVCMVERGREMTGGVFGGYVSLLSGYSLYCHTTLQFYKLNSFV